MAGTEFEGVRVQFVVDSPFKWLALLIQSFVIIFILINIFINTLVDIFR